MKICAMCILFLIPKKTFFGPKTEPKKKSFSYINNKQYERSLSDVIDIRMHFILRTIHFSNNFFDSILIAKFGILLFFKCNCKEAIIHVWNFCAFSREKKRRIFLIIKKHHRFLAFYLRTFYPIGGRDDFTIPSGGITNCKLASLV